jgi:hypothetical protein
MDYTVPAPCPHCGREIRMAMEETDDGGAGGPYALVSSFWQAIGVAEDDGDEEPHTCALTDADIDGMIAVASHRAQTDPYYRDARYEDID